MLKLGLGIKINKIIKTVTSVVGSFVWGTSTPEKWGENTSKKWGS
jgi:hypothetical protein